VVVAVVGTTVLVLGIALVVLPGPAVVVIPVGLGVLATEFVWARRYLRRLRDQVSRLNPLGSDSAAEAAGESADPRAAGGAAASIESTSSRG
jgi:tellurite resistance protein TerC